MESAANPFMFPVLKFYFVFFKHFISILNPVDLSNLSSLSKRVRLLIKSSIPKNMYKLKIYFDWQPRVELILGSSKNMFDVRKDNSFSKLPDDSGRLILPYTEVFVNEMTLKVDFLSTTFNCDISFLCMTSDLYKGRIRNIIDWMKSRQPSIEELILKGTRIEDNEILYLVQNCRVTRNFSFYIDALSHPISPLHPRFTADFVFICGCMSFPWVSLNDVSTFDCIEIRMGGSLLYTVDELNRFLKSWINGSNEIMEFFSISAPYFNRETMLDGIEVEEMDKSAVRLFVTKDYGCQREVRGGFDIRAIKGTKRATFWQEPKEELNEDGRVDFGILLNKKIDLFR